jgi:hypothetical protein
MRPPWSESAALLAAHDLAVPAELTTRTQSIWSRLMSQSIDFAFLPRIDAVTRPVVFTDLSGLARYIERQRHGQAIQLEEIEDIHARRRMATGEGPAAPSPGLRDRGVQIHTRLIDGGIDRSMGFAWLRGQGRDALQAALLRAALDRPIHRQSLMHAA